MKKWRCTVCGYIHEGDEPPEKCPVCGADKSKFEELVEESSADTHEQAWDSAEISAPKAKDPRQVDLGPAPKTSLGRLYQFAIGQMLKHHAHPISTHVPNGVLPVSFIFIVLATFINAIPFGIAAICNMVFVVNATICVILGLRRVAETLSRYLVKSVYCQNHCRIDRHRGLDPAGCLVDCQSRYLAHTIFRPDRFHHYKSHHADCGGHCWIHRWEACI